MSNDLASPFPIQKALTSDMMLGLKTTAPKSRSYNVSISPSNKSVFAPTDQMIFDIPVGRPGTWLDQSQTYLKISVQFATTAAQTAIQTQSGICLDNSAYSFIKTLYVYNGSNLLELIEQYGQLANYLIDHQLSQADKAGLSSMIGTNPYFNGCPSSAAYSQWGPVNALCIPGDRTGLSVSTVATATGISTAIPYVFCLPILSSVVGVNASKMIPLKDLTSSINLQFFLATLDDAIFSAVNGYAWQISSAELVAGFVEIDEPQFNQSDTRIPQFIAGKSYKQTSVTIPNNALGQTDLVVPLKATSMTQLIARFRNLSGTLQGATTGGAYRLSSSVSPNLGSYYWKIADRQIPQKPVFLVNGSQAGTGGQAFAELSKSFHALGSIFCNGSITHLMYHSSLSAIPNSLFGAGPGAGVSSNGNPSSAFNAFSIATELETFSNRSDTILCGVNTKSGPIFLSLNIVVALPSSITCDIFGQYDVIYIIQDGQMSAKA